MSRATGARPGRPGRFGRVGRRAAAALAAAVLAALTAAAVWLGYQRLRDPVAALDHALGEVRVVRDSTYRDTTGAGERRVYRDLTLATAAAGSVRITTSRPDRALEGELPLAFVLGGLRTGRKSLDVIPRHGDNLLVGYEYPHDGGAGSRSPGPADLPALRRAILRVPAQVRAVLSHLRDHGPADADRTCLLGYSLGALFVPAAQRLAAAHGTPFRAVVIGYGGVDLDRLVAANLRFEPALARQAVGWLVGTAVRPLEPALHLPHLTGDFLLLRGSEDTRIPEASVRRLIRLTPEPKEVVRVEGGHMGPGREEVNERVVRRSQGWLARRGHIVRPEASGP